MLTPGSQFGRYRLEAELGAGGMGRVYRAFDTKLHRRVALKVLKVEGASPDDEAVARLTREARLAAALEHPNVVNIHDVGDVDGTPFVSMELVSGTNLRPYVGDASVPLESRVAWLLDIASALAAAHKRGLIHRDIKPENVMLNEDGAIKVLDFGIARRAMSTEGAAFDPTTAAASLQESGIAGTPMYMAPEQLRGEQLDGRCDQFAWGVTAYELLTGASPWGTGEPVVVIGRLLSVEPPALLEQSPDVPTKVAEVVLRALRKSAADRFATMDALSAALRESGLAPQSAPRVPPIDPSARKLALADTVADSSKLTPSELPTKPRKRSGALAALAAVALLGAGAVALFRHGLGASQQPTAPTSTSDAAAEKGVAMTDLPLNEKPNPEAERLYHEGMQEFRAGASVGSKLAQAASLDPSFAAAQLQAAVSALSGGGGREFYVKAVHLRDKLGERDRAFLDALAPCFLPEHSDPLTCGAKLEEVAQKYPRDAELAYAVGLVADFHGDLERLLAWDSKAVQLDPHFAEAIGGAALASAYLGHFDDAQRFVDQGIAESPTAAVCLQVGSLVADLRGDRARFNQFARMGSVNGESYLFADSLLIDGASRDAASDALARKWKALPLGLIASEQNRALISEVDRASLDVLEGDFSSSAARLLRVYDGLVATSYPDRWWSVTRLLAGLRESGDAAGAARFATQLRSRLPGLPGLDVSDDFGAFRDPLSFLIDAQYRGGSITKPQHDAARSEWLAQWKTRTGEKWFPYVWLHGYAAHVETAEEANDALAALTAWGGLPPFPQYTTANYSLGRMYQLAGNLDEALRYLRLAVKSCLPIEYPFEFVRSHLYLGIALADSGDKAGACAEFGEVIKRWGNAKPKSVSAIDAKRRATALSCPP